MKRLTEKQQNIINFITEFENTEGMAPTVYELADHFGVKTSSIFAHLLALQRKGKVSRTSKARSLKVIDNIPQRNTFLSPETIPLENSNGQIGKYHVDKKQIDPKRHFAFQVPDDSMADFGIYSEDIVIANMNQSPKPGDLTIFTVSDEMILRSFYPLPNNRIELRPANKDFQSQVCNPADVKIRGVVTGLQRKY